MNKLLIFLLIMTTYSVAQNELHNSEILINTTIKIQAHNGNSSYMSGTGFFYSILLESGNTIPLIITNKHVVNGFKYIDLNFKTRKNLRPNNEKSIMVTIKNGATTVFEHPDSIVDLVAIPISPIIEKYKATGVELSYISVYKGHIIDDIVQKEELRAIEDVLMIGYPNGLWDKTNNLPLVRKGITASSPYLDFNGKREFLIDIAAFNGSSGSPIYLYRDFYVSKNGKSLVGLENPEVILLGILYAGPLFLVQGKITKLNEASPKFNSEVSSSIPMNIGYVIKASELLKFDELFISIQ